MARERNQKERSLSDFLLYAVLALTVVWGFSHLYDWLLWPWVYLRALELIFIPTRWKLIPEMLRYPWTAHDPLRHQIDDVVFFSAKIFFAITFVCGIYFFIKMKRGMTMEDYLTALFSRYNKWLRYSFDGKKHVYPVMPVDRSPMSYIDNIKGPLVEHLTSQLGPQFDYTTGKFKDKFVERIVKDLLLFIPDVKLRDEDERTEREDAWHYVTQVHVYERTILLGLYLLASQKGVLTPYNWLWLRIQAAIDQQAGKADTHALWRVLVSFSDTDMYPKNGSSSFAEGSGIYSHYLYEVQLSRFQEELGYDHATLRYYKSMPYMGGAQRGFSEVKIRAADLS